MVGVAAGFALEGFHPIAHSIGPFIAERPFEQLKLDFGYQGLGGTFVAIGGSYDYSTEGGTHHAPGDVAAMLSIPGMEVLVPGHGDEVEPLLREVYANGRPTYLRTSSRANAEASAVAVGRMEVLRRGDLATIVAVGPLATSTLAAVADLDVTVLYATSVRAVRCCDPHRRRGRPAARDRGRTLLRRDDGADACRGAPARPLAVRCDRGPARLHPRLWDPRGPRREGRPRCRRDQAPGARSPRDVAGCVEPTLGSEPRTC